MFNVLCFSHNKQTTTDEDIEKNIERGIGHRIGASPNSKTKKAPNIIPYLCGKLKRFFAQ